MDNPHDNLGYSKWKTYWFLFSHCDVPLTYTRPYCMKNIICICTYFKLLTYASIYAFLLIKLKFLHILDIFFSNPMVVYNIGLK